MADDIRIIKQRSRASIIGLSLKGSDWLTANMHPSSCKGPNRYEVGEEYAEDLRKEMTLGGLQVE